MALKTIKVKRKDNNAEFVIINESDFNKDTDILFGEDAPKKEAKKPTKKAFKKDK